MFMRLIFTFMFLTSATQAFSWATYMKCNDGAAVLDWEMISRDGQTLETQLQFVIRDPAVVEYFRTAGDGTIAKSFASNFTSSDELVINGIQFNTPYYLIWGQGGKYPAPETGYIQDDVWVIKEGQGIRVRYLNHYIDERGRSTPLHEIANWYFESCH